MKYYVIYSDIEYTTIEEFDTIEEVKEKVLEIKKDKWHYLRQVIYGKEIEDVA